jgi:PKD repeat protein
MTIPSASQYPESFDTDENLFVVHDALRLRLSEDYNPGDTSISVEGDFLTISRWPDSGLLTLTEQCSDLKDRAISLHYTSIDRTALVISGLELLPEFEDSAKPKRITNVTISVMSRHHNNAAKAIISTQTLAGVKGTVDNQPLGETLEGRINFLRNLVLQPKAWFTANKQVGNVPLEVEFENRSFRLATDGDGQEFTVTWDFGDRSSSTISVTSLISADSMVPDGAIDVLVRDTDSGKIKKIYYQPGLYDVTLTVANNFGSDVCVFEDFINARVKAPDLAIIRFVENTSSQEATPGVPPNGPFEITPKIRSPINTLIQIEINTGENPSTPGVSYGGEALNEDEVPIDPIVSYTWQLGDDLNHPNSRIATAAYSVGGLYDLKLRVDTEFGAYRITTYDEAIDIVENRNIWLWMFSDSDNVRAYEYGLISETFKLTAAPTYTVLRDDSFLDDVPEEERQKSEFRKNTGFNPRSNIGSGLGGTAMLYYASGRGASDPVTSELIRCVEFDGFSGTYVTRPSLTRPWNWAGLHAPSTSYFIFGGVSTYPPGTSPTNVIKQSIELASLTTSSVALTDANYLNGAQELQENVAIYNDVGTSIYGNFSIYRTTWKDSTGYIVRNDGVGPFIRIKSTYRTEGTSGSPFTNIRKLGDIQGPTKVEGELVQMSTAIFFLNNSGSVSKFDPNEGIWRSGGPGVNSLLYRSLQDTSVIGYDSEFNTLLATSDGDKRAYLSFDYSPNAYLKFNEIDLTFVTLGGRPQGDQWMLTCF